jgi:thiol-disulfide isomerase/thioredoxin
MARAKPKPKKAGKPFTFSFVIGLGAGALTALVLAVLLAYVGWLRPLMAQYSDHLGYSLSPPKFSAVAGSKTADYDFKYSDLDGKEHKLSELKGKVLFLNFWATWCGPCVAELPSIAALIEKTKDSPVVFLCFSSENPDKVKKFLAKKGLKLPVFFYSGKPPAAYCTDGIPATFIVGADGKLAFDDVGAARWDDPTAVDFLKKLAKSQGRRS